MLGSKCSVILTALITTMFATGCIKSSANQPRNQSGDQYQHRDSAQQAQGEDDSPGDWQKQGQEEQAESSSEGGQGGGYTTVDMSGGQVAQSVKAYVEKNPEGTRFRIVVDSRGGSILPVGRNIINEVWHCDQAKNPGDDPTPVKTSEQAQAANLSHQRMAFAPAIRNGMRTFLNEDGGENLPLSGGQLAVEMTAKDFDQLRNQRVPIAIFVFSSEDSKGFTGSYVWVDFDQDDFEMKNNNVYLR